MHTPLQCCSTGVLPSLLSDLPASPRTRLSAGGGVSASDASSMAYRAVQLIALLSRHKPGWLQQQHNIFSALQQRWRVNCAAQVGGGGTISRHAEPCHAVCCGLCAASFLRESFRQFCTACLGHLCVPRLACIVPPSPSLSLPCPTPVSSVWTDPAAAAAAVASAASHV